MWNYVYIMPDVSLPVLTLGAKLPQMMSATE